MVKEPLHTLSGYELQVREIPTLLSKTSKLERWVLQFNLSPTCVIFFQRRLHSTSTDQRGKELSTPYRKKYEGKKS
jgi:hypothetical protein